MANYVKNTLDLDYAFANTVYFPNISSLNFLRMEA